MTYVDCFGAFWHTIIFILIFIVVILYYNIFRVTWKPNNQMVWKGNMGQICWTSQIVQKSYILGMFRDKIK